jgi:hypothetical protein
MKVAPLAGPDAAVIGGAFLLTAVLLGATREAGRLPVLRVDRFYPGWGWLEILALAAYAASPRSPVASPGSPAGAAGRLFIVLVVSLHAVFLGVARM